METGIGMEDDFIRRVVIEGVSPEIDGGRFPIKRVNGEQVTVFADIFADGHDLISGVLMHRKKESDLWEETEVTLLINDRWHASFAVTEIGRYAYTLCAWIDPFKTWRRDLGKKISARQDVSVDFLIGAEIIEKTALLASRIDAEWLGARAAELRSSMPVDQKLRLALGKGLLHLMRKHPDKKSATTYEKTLDVVVEPRKALFGSWYEMFPRSCSAENNRHGTFEDCEKRLPYIASMGFDVLYLPPIHPIGQTHRKGKNNAPEAGPEDPGSPWAIGSPGGGHKEIHTNLGKFEDFQRLMRKAAGLGIEIALDIAFQCSPDHPYVRRHPEWFRHRPDGSIQYAENPPKKYEDIFPLDFASDHWRDLIAELKSVIIFWIEQGVRIFRVDNPHTKPLPFWEWLIGSIKMEYPETIFLAEAFTRPKIMYRLAKLGFSQSYTYFAWRNTAYEIRKYFEELTKTQVRDFFRPNLWPNTPDILTEYLQTGGKSAFIIRLILAATLGASYGIYGPAFELAIAEPREPGSEEYRDSEKYEIKSWDIGSQGVIQSLIARINKIRRDHPALQNNRTLTFHDVDNEQILCYSKHTDDLSSVIVVAVNLDPHHTHSGWVNFPLSKFNIEPEKSFQMHDLLGSSRYLWNGEVNFVELDPRVMPAHIFTVRRKVRTEYDFDYFL